MYYDYRKAMIQDIKDYIWMNDLQPEEGMSQDEYLDYLSDELWDKDEITGNGPKFYDTEDNCSKYLAGNIDLLYLAARDFCIDDDINILIKHYEDKSLARYFDCTIRCYLLGDCIDKVLEELNIINN